MITRFEVAVRPEFVDSRGEQAAQRIRSFLAIDVGGVRSSDVYHLEGTLEGDEAELAG